MDHADRRFRAAIATLPDGTYHAVEVIDNDCFQTMEIPIDVVLTVQGDEIAVDFSNSAPQIQG